MEIILSKLFGFPVEERIFDKACDILQREFGLVDGNQTGPNGSQVLVHEDLKGTGIFRVHCYANDNWELAGEGRRYDVFRFHYWIERYSKDLLERDPMRRPLERILGLSNNRYEPNHWLLSCAREEIGKLVK